MRAIGDATTQLPREQPSTKGRGVGFIRVLALENEESRTSAVDAIRALIEAIVLEPDGDELRITLKGNLAGTPSAARDKRSPNTGDLFVK